MGDKMNDKYAFLDDITNNPCFIKLNKIGLINWTKLRNLKIKREFIMLRKRMDPLDAVEYLSKKYFRSASTIQTILYRRRLKRLR